MTLFFCWVQYPIDNCLINHRKIFTLRHIHTHTKKTEIFEPQLQLQQQQQEKNDDKYYCISSKKKNWKEN